MQCWYDFRMSNIPMFTNQEAVFDVGSIDDDGAFRPAAFSAEVDGYPSAYIAVVGANHLHFRPIAPGTYTVTISGHAAGSGAELPVSSYTFDVAAPPESTATQFKLSTPVLRATDIATPGDPGTDTVTGTTDAV